MQFNRMFATPIVVGCSFLASCANYSSLITNDQDRDISRIVKVIESNRDAVDVAMNDASVGVLLLVGSSPVGERPATIAFMPGNGPFDAMQRIHQAADFQRTNGALLRDKRTACVFLYRRDIPMPPQPESCTSLRIGVEELEMNKAALAARLSSMEQDLHAATKLGQVNAEAARAFQKQLPQLKDMISNLRIEAKNLNSQAERLRTETGKRLEEVLKLEAKR